ncbi:MAG: phage tail protein [Synergistaceae bacterium]|jgi:phage tail-like protein|nr:phage tail protein [Synergistaceae bacterium]
MGVIPVFPGNPRQKHQFIARVDGFDTAWFEEATIPSAEHEIDEFNPAGSVRSTKFAGRTTFDDPVLKKGMPSDSGDLVAWNWLTTATNTERGELGDPTVYKKDVEIVHVDRVGSPIQTWTLIGAFVKKIEWGDNSGASSEHVVETITLSIDDERVS